MRFIELLINEKINKINKIVLFSFLFTFLICFITHIYFFTNNFFSEDNTIWYRGNNIPAHYVGLGRWGMAVFGQYLRSNYLASMIMGFLSFIYISISVSLICSIFKIKNKLSAICISLIISTFPTLTYTFSYLQQSDLCCLSILFAVMAVYFSDNGRFIIAGFFLMLSLSIYQAYVGVAFVLFIILLLKNIINIEGNCFLKLKYYILTMCVAALLYKLSIVFMITIFNVSLSNYAGFNDGFRFKLHKVSYEYMYNFFFGNKFFYNENLLLPYFIFIVSSLLVIFYLLYRNKKNIVKRIIISVIFLSLIPFAIFHVEIFSKHVGSDTLTIYSMAILLILPVILIDNIDNILVNTRVSKLLSIIILINTFVLSFNYFLIDNIYYLKSKSFYERTQALTIRIVDRIEQLEGFSYNSSNAIAVIGSLKYVKSSVMFDIIKNDRAFYAGQFVGYDVDTYNAERKIINYIDSNIGIPVHLENQEEIKKIKECQEFKDMSCWPATSSVKKIKNTIVVKLSDK